MLKRWTTSLFIFSDKAKEIRDLLFKKFMTTNGRRLFFTEVPIDYPRNQKQIEQAEKLLENMATRKNLDLPYGLELLAYDIEHLHLLDDSQSFISSPCLDEEKYANLINACALLRICFMSFYEGF